MPEFSNYINASEKLRLVVSHTPREVAAGFRVSQRGEYDQATATELLRTLFELVFEIHGPVGAAEFMQEATR